MPADVDSRPKTKHFNGPIGLEFRVNQRPYIALVLRFHDEDSAKAFRKGFRIASRHELQRFDFPCEWMTAGAAFFTPWQFFADAWALDLIPFLVVGTYN